MAITVRIGLFACLWCLGSQAVAEEKLFTSPTGYSLRYPSNWVLVTKANLQLQPIERQIRFAMQINTRGVDSMLSVNEREDGTYEATINVVFANENPPVAEHLLEMQKRQLTRSHSKAGLKVEWIKGRIGSLGAHRATIFDKQATASSVPQPLRFRQYFLPSSIEDKGLVVTCTAFAEDFERYAPQFDAILSTFKLEVASEINIDDKSHILNDPAQESKASTVLTRLLGSTDERPMFNSPKGYSFRYPQNWTLVTDATKGDLPRELRDQFVRDNIDFEKFDVALLVEREGDYATNMMVRVINVPLPITQRTLNEVGDELLRQNPPSGLTIEHLARKIGMAGASQSLIFDFLAKRDGIAFDLRHRQYFLRSGGQTLIVNFASKNDEFERYLPAFESVMASFKVAPPTLMPESSSPIPPATPTDSSDTAFIYCVIGAMLLFGAIGILKIGRRSSQRATREHR